MGVFKEEAHMFETVSSKQKRIFNDAADYGYPYNTKNIPNEIQNLIDAVNGFKEVDKKYPDEPNLVRNRIKWEGGVSVDVIIFWEQEDGYYFGTKYSISFNKIKPNHPANMYKGCDAFIGVYIQSYNEPKK